jgi:hypothetical protein
MEHLPFKVVEYNDYRDDKAVELNSDSGILYVYIGKLAIQIVQNHDDNSVEIFTLDAELLEQELGSLKVRFDDIEELPKD